MSDYFDRLNRETREYNSRVRNHTFSSSSRSSDSPAYGYFDPYRQGCGCYTPASSRNDNELISRSYFNRSSY